jgi:hypothetical protein
MVRVNVVSNESEVKRHAVGEFPTDARALPALVLTLLATLDWVRRSRMHVDGHRGHHHGRAPV